ncbi:MAG: diguanylate cyclase [Solidesulfovibrio sp.]|uniref:sensor domain-containing diguanylate cyclase n=1 Tax=Solidesulfovibrio sp. TaxID=2910990 RepID=UPI0031584DA2
MLATFNHIWGLETLKGKLRFYTLLLVALPFILVTSFFFLFQREQVLDGALRQIVSSLRQEGNVMRSWMGERFDDARFLAGIDVVRQGDVPAMLSVLHYYQDTHPFVSDVIYVSAQGHITGSVSAEPGIYVGDRPYFQQAQAGKPSLTSVPAGRASGQPICLFVTPIQAADGGFGGAIAIIVVLSSLDRWLLGAKAAPGGEVLLCDGQGRILAPSSAVAAGGGLGQAKAPAALLETGETGSLLRSGDGETWLGATMPLGDDGWRLFSQVAVSDVLAGYHRQSWWFLLAALCTLAVVTPLVLRLSRNLERPLLALAAYARTLRATRYREECPLEFPKDVPIEIRELLDAFCQMADEMRGHIEETERISVMDALTGLYNRRFLFSGGTKLLEAAARADKPFACLMIDVDHFKDVNDVHGHSAGDRVLAHLGRVLLGCVRKSDLVARYGGEEFAVLLTGADTAQAAELAERIRGALVREPCRVDDVFLPVTASFGVAEVREAVEYGESALEDMLARADKALYRAKAAGRDQVVVETRR